MFNEEYEDCLPYVTHLRDEHRHLKECLMRVEQQWRQDFRRRDPGHGINDLIASLANLREELSHHLTEEESGGCIEEAVAHAPRLGPEAMALEHEDPRLLQQLDGLISKLKRGPKSLKKIEKDYNRLAAQICDHVAAESRIMKASFGMDVD